MKIGDKVKMSAKKLNHLGNDVSAYSGMEGVVTDIYDDGAFALNCGNAILVVSMNNAFKKPQKGIWLWLNGQHIFHKRIDKNITQSFKKWFQWFIPQNLMRCLLFGTSLKKT